MGLGIVVYWPTWEHMEDKASKTYEDWLKSYPETASQLQLRVVKIMTAAYMLQNIPLRNGKAHVKKCLISLYVRGCSTELCSNVS